MKIFLSCGHDTYGSGASFARAFRELGVEVATFFDDERYDAAFPKLKNRYTHRLFWKWFSAPVRAEFLKAMERERPDMILVFKGMFYPPGFLRKIKQRFPTTPLFCFNPDNPFDHAYYGVSNNWIRKSIPSYDAYFIWGRFLLEPLRAAGAKRVEYVPFGYDSAIHYPVAVSPEERKIYGSDVAFVGSWDPEREAWLSGLLDYNLKIWGNSWHKASVAVRAKWQERAATGEDFARVCASAKVLVDMLRPHMAQAHTMKIFEIAGSGGFLLSSRGQEFKDFFKEGSEFVCFDDAADMRAKLDFFLAHEPERRAIAERARARSLTYPYSSRVAPILKVYEEIRAKAV